MRNQWLALGVVGALLPVGLGAGGAVASPVSAVTLDSAAAQPAHVAKKKKKKDKGKNKSKDKAKDKAKDTATVTATWTVKRSSPLNGGLESEELTVKLTDAEATFANDKDTSADGKAQVRLIYRAHYFTDNSSWTVGCETEVVDSTAVFIGKLGFHVYATNWRHEKGNSERLANGWAVELDNPTDQFDMVTTGMSKQWDSLLQEKCLRTSVNEPLGWWSQYFVGKNQATGKLNGGGKGVILSNVYSKARQSYELDGKIKFSDSVEKRGQKDE